MSDNIRDMKKFFLIAAAVAMSAACTGFGDDDPSNDGSGIELIGAYDDYDLSCDKDTVRFDVVAVKGNDYASWIATSDSDWLEIVPKEGAGPANVELRAAANPGNAVRKAEVSFRSGSSSVTISVGQSLNAGALPAESWYSTRYQDRTDRELAGLRGPVKSIFENQYTTYDKYYYDEAGHLIKEEYHNLDRNSVEVMWEHEYDSEGHRTRSYFKDSDGNPARVITYEYANKGKYVATDPSIWVQTLYTSGKGFPLSVWKDLSAMHYVDDTIVYYEKQDYTYEFKSDGVLTITTSCQIGRDAEPEVHSYTVVYNGDYPASNADQRVTATFASNGMPLTYSEGDGSRTFSFEPNDKVLVTREMHDKNPGGFVSTYWAEYLYNSNMDMVQYKRAHYAADQVYYDIFSKYWYDSYGNWVRREGTDQAAMQHDQIYSAREGRTIEYYR